MTCLGLSLALLCVSAPPRAAGLICIDPTSGDKMQVKPAQVEQALKVDRDLMKKRGVHILDLPIEVQDRRRRLPKDLVAKDWCVVRSHVIALEGALVLAKIDQGFLSAKFSRVERWVRAGIDDEKKKTDVERMMATAAAQVADRKFEPANALLNRVIAILFGSTDLWAIPDKLPEVSEAAGATTVAGAIDPEEVKEACPAVVKKGKATLEDLDAMLGKVQKLMDQRRVRAGDIKAGEQLLADLASYRKLNALFPATRVLCAMHKRITDLVIDLGTCMKRFQEVNHRREKNGVSDVIKDRFAELVRAATDHIANQQYDQAHAELEDLLVLLGAPRLPSAELTANE